MMQVPAAIFGHLGLLVARHSQLTTVLPWTYSPGRK